MKSSFLHLSSKLDFQLAAETGGIKLVRIRGREGRAKQAGGFGSNNYLAGHGEAEQGVDDVGVVVQLLVHHQGQDAHLGGKAVVQLDDQHLVQGGLVSSGGLNGAYH